MLKSEEMVFTRLNCDLWWMLIGCVLNRLLLLVVIAILFGFQRFASLAAFCFQELFSLSCWLCVGVCVCSEAFDSIRLNCMHLSACVFACERVTICWCLFCVCSYGREMLSKIDSLSDKWNQN